MLRGLQKTKYILIWLATVALVTIVLGVLYLAVQQVLRQSANDPQIQMAEDMSRDLSAGQSYSSYDSNQQIDIRKSLAPFYIIFDEQGHPIVSNGRLDDGKPSIPYGLFAIAQRRGEYQVAWQPRTDTRIALVLLPVSGINHGFVG